MMTTQGINGRLVNGLYDVSDTPIQDNAGDQVTSDAPDANSLMVIPGMKSDNQDVNPMAEITRHYALDASPANRKTCVVMSRVETGIRSHSSNLPAAFPALGQSMPQGK